MRRDGAVRIRHDLTRAFGALSGSGTRERTRGEYRRLAGRPEAAHALARFAANYETRAFVERNAGRQTLGEFAESWWQTRAGHRPSTWVRDQEALDRDVLPFFGDVPLGRLERADVQQWIEELS